MTDDDTVPVGAPAHAREGIAAFRAGLESQADALITQYRDRLVRRVNALRR